MTNFLKTLTKITLVSVTCLLGLMSCAGIATTQSTTRVQADSDPEFGLLVMAHGGSDEWNAAVEESAANLSTEYPVEVAFGMADAGSMEVAVRNLEAEGVEHVGVVRLFISGTSWYVRTQQIFGMQEGAPSKEAAARMADSRPAARMRMGFWKIDTDLSFHLSNEGLADADEMDGVIFSRVRKLSQDPGNEVMLVVAHGTSDDSENDAWVGKITQRTLVARRELGLHDIKVFTLREDWAEKKAVALAGIRNYMEQASADGLTPIVVPYRVQGFGPYEEALQGLDYRADKQGLLPHANVSLWIANQADQLMQEASSHARLLAQANP